MEIDNIEPGFFYHIYNRGINREIIFPEDRYYKKFLSLFEKYMPQVTETLAYCLLPTHFHFLLFIKDHQVGLSSKQFSNFFNAYAQWFNKRRNRNGGLFQRPFRRRRVLNEDYLRQIIYYIHRNPMHHHFVENPANYLYSSYSDIISEDGTTQQNTETNMSIPRRATPSGYLSCIERKFVLELFETKGNFIFFINKDLI